MQDEGLQGLEAEDPDRPDLVGALELHIGRRNRDHGGHVQCHQGLGVRVVAEQHLATEAVLQLGHLAPGVTDQVHMGVLPLEGHALLTVPRVDVGHWDPTEGRPGLGSQRFGVHGFGVT